MRYWTLGEIKRKIELEHDLLEETFISSEELLGYIEEGISIAESLIISKMEDYFLTFTDWLPLSDYNTLPDDIYANKLRKVEIRNASGHFKQVYKNNHLKVDNGHFQMNDMYNIVNRSGEMPKIFFEDNSNFKPVEYRLHYIRNANTLINDTDICDIPEVAMLPLISFVKMRCFEKEKDQMSATSRDDVAQYRQLLDDVLTNIVDDGSPFFLPDMDFYGEYDCEGFYE